MNDPDVLQLAAIVRDSGDAIIGTTLAGIITSWNGGAERLYGYTAAEAIGQPVALITPADCEDEVPTILRKLVAGAGIEHYDTLRVTKDGRLVNIALMVSPIRDAAGAVIGASSIGRDVTRQKEAENALRASARAAQLLMERASDAILLSSPDQQILAVNERACDLFGYPREELLELTENDILLPPTVGALAPHLDEILAGKVVSTERPARCKDGTVIIADLSIRRLDDGRIITIARDITARKQADQRVQANAARYRQMFDANPSVQWVVDPETYAIVDANQAASDFYGYSLDELKRMKVTDINVSVTPGALTQIAQAVLSAPTSFLFKHQLASGEIRDIESFSGPLDVGGRRLLHSILHDVTARTRAEERLRTSEERYRVLARNLPKGMVLLFDPELRILLIEGEALQMHGYDKHSIEGKTLGKVLPLARYADLEPYYQAALTGQAQTIERDYGGMLYQLQFLPTNDEQGRPFGGMVLFRDITAERQSALLQQVNSALIVRDGIREEFAAELRESEERFRQLAETVAHVFWLTSPDGNELIYANPAYAAVWGRPMSELKDDPWDWAQALHSEDRARVLSDFEQRVAPSGFEEEYRIIRPDGDIRWLHVKRFPVKDAAGHHYRTVGIAEDITEAKRVEEERDRFFTLSLDMLCIADFKGFFLRMNPSWQQTLGFTPAELMARPFIEWVHPDDQSATVAEVARLAAGLDTLTFENRLLARDGAYKWLHWCATSTVDAQRIYATAHDITAEKQAMAALQRARDEADRANQAKSEFLSRMSHELRTPLHAILGFGQLLEMGDLAPMDQESVDQILAGGRHLLTLINEVLDITGIESGYVSLSPEPLVLADLVAETIDLLDPLATQSHVTLDAACDQRCHQHVLADQQRLKQVLLNLLANAIKYNRPGGRVRVSCGAAAENRVRLEVRDTGVGIPQAQLPRLFTPFERLDATHTTIEGTGLGLALAKQLMEAMGGRIGVDSVVGVGTTFWIELPLIAASIDQVNGIPIHDAPTLLAPLPPVQPSRTLLSIEDNLANFRLIERVLSHWPELVLLPAMQGRLGLELARQHHPDVILLDLHLPDIPGDEILHALRADPATQGTPVIMLSADANPRRRAELLAAGATAYLTKPLDIAQFLAVIDETLEIVALNGL